jgi:hypothetical protein
MADGKVFYYPPPDPATLAKLRAAHPRTDPKHSFDAKAANEWMRRQSEGAKNARKNKALAYAASEARHAVQGPAPDDVIAHRVATCRACPGRVDVFQGVSDDGGVGFCTKCGCPASQRSKLSVKLTLAGVACPLGKFGKVQGTGGSVKTAVQAVKGMAQTLGAIVKQAVTGDGASESKP